MSTHSGYLWSRLIHIRGIRAVFFLLVTGGIFAAIAASIHLPGLNLIDHEVTRAVQQNRTLPMDLILYGATAVGNSLTLVLVCAAAALILLAQGHRRAALLMSLTLLSLPLDEVIKLWAVRPRPDSETVLVLVPQVGLSFPSGHAMGSTAVYGFLAAMIWIRAAPGFARSFWTALLACIPALVALSRIYLGAHWLSDVIAGIAAGSFTLVPLVALYKHWHRVTPPTPPSGKMGRAIPT